jgi:hypothetical protein
MAAHERSRRRHRRLSPAPLDAPDETAPEGTALPALQAGYRWTAPCQHGHQYGTTGCTVRNRYRHCLACKGRPYATAFAVQDAETLAPLPAGPVLGALCPHKHTQDGLPFSLRRKADNRCVLCELLPAHV